MAAAGLSAALLSIVGPAAAAELPASAAPEAQGFSGPRLARIAPWFQSEVESGRIPGAVLLVARHGKVVYDEAVGFRDRDGQARMGKDTVFRIGSMTKPFTSVAIMMLVEEGKIALWLPVSRYLPEFKQQVVGIDRVPVRREMTVQDLLRHTAGLTYAAGEGMTGANPVQLAYAQANVGARDQTIQEFIAKLARQPLMHEPGTHWDTAMPWTCWAASWRWSAART